MLLTTSLMKMGLRTVILLRPNCEEFGVNLWVLFVVVSCFVEKIVSTNYLKVKGRTFAKNFHKCFKYV